MSSRCRGTCSPLPTTIAASSVVNKRLIERLSSSSGSARRYASSAAPRICTRNGWIRFMWPTCPIVGRSELSPTSVRSPPSRPASHTRPRRSLLSSRNRSTLTWRIVVRSRRLPVAKHGVERCGVGRLRQPIAKRALRKHLRKFGEQLQVLVGRMLGHEQDEQLVDGLAVRRVERDRLGEPRKRADRLAQPVNAAVRYRDTLPESRQAELLARGEARGDARVGQSGAAREHLADGGNARRLPRDIEV